MGSVVWALGNFILNPYYIPTLVGLFTCKQGYTYILTISSLKILPTCENIYPCMQGLYVQHCATIYVCTQIRESSIPLKADDWSFSIIPDFFLQYSVLATVNDAIFALKTIFFPHTHILGWCYIIKLSHFQVFSIQINFTWLKLSHFHINSRPSYCDLHN